MISDHAIEPITATVTVNGEIHTIENKGDYLHRNALEKLMNGSEQNNICQNILLTIKTKEIYQTLEDTLDECEKIANLFEAIRIKYQ